MSSYVTKKTPGNTAWFTHDRFGMFIHWGLYSMPARHEWVKTRERTPEEVYDRYFQYFDPDLYDPKEWARQAKAAGMRYAVFTTKHHEGFCMFDSQYTDYKCTSTPAGRDLTREFVDAFRAEGIHIGFYYSLIDWHHPDFTIDVNHPRRDDPDAKEQNEGRDMHRYAEYMRNQIRELLTNYGKIDILWLDFSYSQRRGEGDKAWLGGKGKDDWESEELIKLAQKHPAGNHHRQPRRAGAGPVDPRAVPADRLVPPPQDRGAGHLGGLPDPFRLLGILPRRVHLEISGDAHPDADQHRLQRRQPDYERRPDRPRIFGLPRRGGAEGLCRLDEVQQPLDLRLHQGRAGV